MYKNIFSIYDVAYSMAKKKIVMKIVIIPKICVIEIGCVRPIFVWFNSIYSRWLLLEKFFIHLTHNTIITFCVNVHTLLRGTLWWWWASEGDTHKKRGLREMVKFDFHCLSQLNRILCTTLMLQFIRNACEKPR